MRACAGLARGVPDRPDNFVSAAWCSVCLGMYVHVPMTRASLVTAAALLLLFLTDRQYYWWISASLHCCNMPVHARCCCVMGPSVCIPGGGQPVLYTLYHDPDSATFVH